MGYTANMLGSVTKYTKMADKYENVNEEGTDCRIPHHYCCWHMATFFEEGVSIQ